MNRLRDGLYIGTAQNARALDADHDFDRVITLGYYDGLSYEKPSTTTDEHVFPDGPHDYADFETAALTVLDAVTDADTDRVFVHCQAGASRSVSVCAAVLAVLDDSSFRDAVMEIKQRHPPANPQPEVTASAKRFIDTYCDVCEESA